MDRNPGLGYNQPRRDPGPPTDLDAHHGGKIVIALRKTFEHIWQTYSGEAAWQAVVDISRFHRIQASPGYRQAAQWIYQRLVHDGLQAQIHSYPANTGAQFWGYPSFQEWHGVEGHLTLIEPDKEVLPLADFRACPTSLIQRSASFDGEAEVVALDRGEEEGDYEGLDVKGKVVLTRGEVRRVWELAVRKRGAIGILFDGMRVIDPVRPAGDLMDIRQYTSFWWQPGDDACFGFVLTPRQGQMLRDLLKREAGSVRVRAHVDARLYDGALEAVTGTIPGDTDQEVLIVAHLCHPQPSANDNASGAAAALEAARTLQALIAQGALPRPKRTLRFLWVPEVSGTYAYLAEREADLGQFVAGINLDMVGEDQNQTGSVWLIERPSDSVASFAPELLAQLRDELLHLKGMVDISASHAGNGSYPLYRQAEMPFSGGSDHYVLSDPTVGVPTPMLIQWPDRFYHTSADTPDRTDPRSLARSGSLAAMYAYWLAAAGAQDASWLGHEMVARFKMALVEAAHSDTAKAIELQDAPSLAGAVRDLDRRLAYLSDRQQAALDTLKRLEPQGCSIGVLQDEVRRVAHQELAWAKGALDLYAAMLGWKELPEPAPIPLSTEEREASQWVPVRTMRGPIPLGVHLQKLEEKEREAWRQMLKERSGMAAHTLTDLALYWADGQRSLLEIADLVEMESGQRDVELLMAYMRLLHKLGFVELQSL